MGRFRELSSTVTLADEMQAEITDVLFRGVHIKRFWVGEWLTSKSDVHKTVAVETVMQYLADGTIGVGEGSLVMSGCCLFGVCMRREVYCILTVAQRRMDWCEDPNRHEQSLELDRPRTPLSCSS